MITYNILFYSIAVTYTLLVLPPLIYLLMISLAGLRKPSRVVNLAPARGRIAVLIPAHNESVNITRTIYSLQTAAINNGPIDIHVIADNCSDNTAEIARRAGVRVLERYNKNLRGKGAALQWAIQRLADKDYDYLMIVDADSVVNDVFFSELRATLGLPGTDVVQARYEALANEHSSVKRLAILGFNVLRARGRTALGGSAGIMGNGFVLSKRVLAKVPFRANSIVEDLEYHIRLVASGIRVRFCDRACIYGEMPSDDRASDIQSSRWEGGRFRLFKVTWFSLLLKSLKGLVKGQWYILDAFLDLMLLPIGYMLFILILGLLFPYTQSVAAIGIITIGIYVLGAAHCGKGIRELAVLKKIPIFLMKKLLRIPLLINASSRAASWHRTPRRNKASL